MQRHSPVAEGWCQLHSLEQTAVHTAVGSGLKPRTIDCAAGLDRSRAVTFHSIVVDHVDGLLHTTPVFGLATDREFAPNWSAY